MAKAQTFRLKKVLQYRQHLEELRAMELSKTQAAKHSAENQLKNLTATKEQMLNEQNREMQQTTTMPLSSLRIHNDYLQHLQGRIGQQKETLKALSKEEEKHRIKLQEAVKDRKIVEKLEDRFKAQRKAYISRLEAQKIDEVAIRKSPQNGMTGA